MLLTAENLEKLCRYEIGIGDICVPEDKPEHIEYLMTVDDLYAAMKKIVEQEIPTDVSKQQWFLPVKDLYEKGVIVFPFGQYQLFSLTIPESWGDKDHPTDKWIFYWSWYFITLSYDDSGYFMEQEEVYEELQEYLEHRQNHGKKKCSLLILYNELVTRIPENRKLCDDFIQEFGDIAYPFAFQCIYLPMVESYNNGNMDLFRRYSEFVEYALDNADTSVFHAISDEVVDRLEYDEPNEVWVVFKNNVSKGFHY